MPIRHHHLIYPALFCLVILPTLSRAQGAPATTQPAAPDTFMRFVDDGNGGGSLQTADVTFQNKQGVTVHLVAAIHIAEGNYYKQLNDEFKGYDSVLYELVSPKGSTAPKPGDAEKSKNPITEFQQFLKNSLELDFQLDDIDYQAPNFVHADLDAETFAKMQKDRGETFEQLMLKQLLNSFTQPDTAENQPSLSDVVDALTKPDMERQIKVLIARQLGQMDTTAMGLDGPGGTVIVTERNKAAFKVLTDTLAKGQKNIAIFYGAAHMPDMTKRLADLGFSPTKTDWKVAWDLAIRPDQPSALDKFLDGVAHAVNDPDNNGN